MTNWWLVQGETPPSFYDSCDGVQQTPWPWMQEKAVIENEKTGGEKKKSKIESPLFSELIKTSIRMHERIAIVRIDLFLISLGGRLVLGQPAEVWLQFHVKYPNSCPSTSINLWDATANTGPEIASL